VETLESYSQVRTIIVESKRYSPMAKQQPKEDSVISVLLPTRGRREVLKSSIM
jgi:hypothetical protein